MGILAGDPVVSNPPASAGQGQEEPLGQADVLVQSQLAEVRRLADLPQSGQRHLVPRPMCDLLIAGQRLERLLVQRLGRQVQALALGRLGQRLQQQGQGGEIEF